jgi:valyl-tRNA synthetase
MLHPLMPFITEELWHAMGERAYDLIVAKWPAPEAQVDRHAKAELQRLIAIVDATRAMRTELNISWSKKVDAQVIGEDTQMLSFMEEHLQTLDRLAKIGAVSAANSVSFGSAQIVVGNTTLAFPLAGIIAVNEEIERITKAYESVMKERDSLAQRLANPNFTERAKPEAVEKARADHEAKAAEAERLRAALERLG